MNGLSDFLVESILNEDTPKQVVALFGGGFKPPTKGHLEVVNKGLQQNPEVTEVKILVGGGERNGFTQDQSVKIWNLYNNINLINKPATIIPVSSPFTYYKEYLKDHPEDKTYIFIGSRPDDEKDQIDVKQRSEFVKKYSDNVIPVEVSTGGGVSGTMARKLFKTNLDDFKNMFPENLTDIDWKKILDILNNKNSESEKVISNKTEPLLPLTEIDYDSIFRTEAYLKVNLKKRSQGDILSDIRSLPGVTIVGSKGLQNNPTKEESILSIKVDPYPFTKMDNVSAIESVDYITNEIRKINGVERFQILKKKINEDIIDKTDFVLPRGKKMILQAEDEDYDRGLIVELTNEGGYKMNYWYGDDAKVYPVEVEVDGESIKPDAIEVNMKFHPELNENDPKKGTGKKPKGSGRRLYTDEDPKDTVGIKFSTRQDIVDTLNKKSFKAKSHARQSQIINLIHQRVRAAYGRAKDPDVKKRLKSGLDYITDKKEASKKKTQRLKDQKENIDPKSQAKHKGKAAPFGSAYEPLNENATYSSKIDYKQQIKDLTKHMLDKGMNIQPLPKVIFKHGDQENASQFLGKTAYYSPDTQEIVLYTEGRHPKDIVRSFAHEMIHHIQNLEGRLGGINTTNTTQDDNLNDIEREAYTKGNMTFRNWTDNKDGEEVTSLNESPQPTYTMYSGITGDAWEKIWKDKNFIDKVTNVTNDEDFALDYSYNFKTGEYEDKYVEISNIPLDAFVSVRDRDYGDDDDFEPIADLNNEEKINAIESNDLFLVNLLPYKSQIKTTLIDDSLNEIGDTSSKVFNYKKTEYGIDAKSFKEITDEDDRIDDIETENVYEFETDLGTKYVVNFEVEHYSDSKELNVHINFTTIGNLRMDPTNKGEQYAVMATISDIIINWVNEWDKYFYISQLWIEPKVEDSEEVEYTVFSKRGRLYKVYLDKQISRLNKNYEVQQKPNAFKIVPKFKNLKETKNKKPYKHKSGFDDKLGKDPFGLNQFAREIMGETEKLTTEFLEEQEKVRIFNPNCDCDKT